MAELMIPNFVGSYQQAYANSAEQRRAQELEQRRQQLAGLASQAYGAPEDQRSALVQQAVGIDPDAGFGLDKQLRSGDEAREAQLLNSARMIDAAPEPLKNAIFQQVKPRIAAHLPGLPDAYNEQVGQGIKAYIAAHSQPRPELAPRVVGNALVDSGGNVLYEAPEQQQYQWSEQAQSWIPKPMGRSAASPAQAAGAPNIAADVPANVREAIAANPQAFEAVPDGGSISIPNPQMVGGQSGLAAIPVAGLPPRQQVRTLSPEELASRGYPAGSVVQVDKEGNENVRYKPDARVGSGGEQPLSAGEAAKVRTNFKETKDALTTFKLFAQALQDIPSNLQLMTNGEAKGRLGTAYNNARAALRIVYNTGVLQPGELPMLESALRDPTSFSAIVDPRTRPQIKAQLDELFRAVENSINTQVQSYPQIFNPQVYEREKARLTSPAQGRPVLPPGFSWED